MSELPLMQGFPPKADRQVNLANWLTPPFNRWSFQHVREIVPSASIHRGEGPVAVLGSAAVMPHIKAGKLTALAVSTRKRSSMLPDTPTFAEVGLAPMNRMSSFGIIGQKGLPADVVRKINAAARTALEDAVVRQRIEESGAAVVGGTAEQYTADINTEFTQLKRVVEEQKLTLD